MTELQFIQNFAKTIGIQPSHLIVFIAVIVLGTVMILIAIYLDSKQLSGFNTDVIKFRRYLPNTTKVESLPKEWNILKIQALINGRPSVTSTNAQIIQLAVWGYIKIEKVNEKIEIYRTEKSPSDLPFELREFYDSIFDNRDTVSNKRKLFDKDQKGYFVDIGMNLVEIFKDLHKGFEERGYYRLGNLNLRIVREGVPFLILLMFTFFYTPPLYLTIPLIITIFTIPFLKRKTLLPVLLTKEGKKALKEIQGFYMYLKVAEEDRVEFHNNPERYHGNFVELLPYAILFGMEEKWLRYMPLQNFDWSDDVLNENFSEW